MVKLTGCLVVLGNEKEEGSACFRAEAGGRILFML